MRRRDFLATSALGVLALAGARSRAMAASSPTSRESFSGRRGRRGGRGHKADLVIAGGGLGGCAAALAALRAGLRVVLTEETDWVGGQLTSQGVPPDEHRWIETHGSTRTYRQLRGAIREHYRRWYPLTAAARARLELNPGSGSVSRLCCEPRVALAVLEAWFQPWRSSGQLVLLTEHRPVAAEVEGDRIRRLVVEDVREGGEVELEAPWFVDATELGELLALARVEHVTGAEARDQTGEPHAAERADPANQQAFTLCFAVDHVPGERHTIEPPPRYDFWRRYVPRLRPPWPGPLLSLTYSHPQTLEPKTLGFDPETDADRGALNLWRYRRIAARSNFEAGTFRGDISLINWPQNDYLEGNLVGVRPAEAARHVQAARELSLALLHWLQTEVPRPDGGAGWPGLRLRADVMGTRDGLAKYPYVRESRRIRAVFTVLEQHLGVEARGRGATAAEPFHDTVAVGSYPVDLHPTSRGDNYIDFAAYPFQVPLGALLPVRLRNLLPACKNLGTTHVTNGCYRLHPVEWSIGEAVGHLVAYCCERRTEPHDVREDRRSLETFQGRLQAAGVDTHWPGA